MLMLVNKNVYVVVHKAWTDVNRYNLNLKNVELDFEIKMN